jgi:hypothetical protein
MSGFGHGETGTSDLPRRIREAREAAKDVHWRLHDITITVG